MKWLGITTFPSYMGEPQRNRVAEALMRRLNEQSLYARRSKNLELAKAIIGKLVDRYDPDWLIEQLGRWTAVQVRAGAYASRPA